MFSCRPVRLVETKILALVIVPKNWQSSKQSHKCQTRDPQNPQGHRPQEAHGLFRTIVGFAAKAILQCYRSSIIGVIYFSLEYLRDRRNDFYADSCRSTESDSAMLY